MQHSNQLIITDAGQTLRYAKELLDGLEQARADLRKDLAADAARYLQPLRFDKTLPCPLGEAFGRAASDRMNFVEFLNQSHTYLVGLAAIHYLLTSRQYGGTFILYRSTRGGRDIENQEERLIAEVFAAVHPDSNRKLKEDIRKIIHDSSLKKYIFFSSHATTTKAQIPPDISVYRIAPADLVSLRFDRFSQVAN